MSRRVKEQLKPMIAIVGLAIIAAVVGGYILVNQRVRGPFADDYTVRVQMPTGQALTPGQGQTATVAGVKVGEISRVELRDGVALVSLKIDPGELPRRDLRADARLILRPRTPLLDMTVDIDPGSPSKPVLADGVVLDTSRTTANVNLDEITASLDTDTRRWMQTMLQAGGRGLGDRGVALREALQAGAPTLDSARRVSAAVASRRRELGRAIHNLKLLSGALAEQDESVAQLVDGGDRTFAALAGESAALRTSVARLPGTLNTARTALTALTPFANAAAPALRSLVPTAKALPDALRGVEPLLVKGTPALRDTTTLTRSAVPVLQQLEPALRSLSAQTGDLKTVFDVLERLTNELAHVPGGKQNSYLFSLAWFAHNGNSLVSGQDANGVFWHGSVIASCSTVTTALSPVAKVLGPIVERAGVCPRSPGTGD
ncbi:hypothetical protein DSM112329_05350 [Paraconexibacter sp. AEG42_29]|uniref:Mce/MlaD domain-containing protein n=1 Tax=Paraconexibacter sp. AEG42_29 TaxID=2997339 RepID=A0AAU7B3J2_9ACTN